MCHAGFVGVGRSGDKIDKTSPSASRGIRPEWQIMLGEFCEIEKRGDPRWRSGRFGLPFSASVPGGQRGPVILYVGFEWGERMIGSFALKKRLRRFVSEKRIGRKS